MKLLLTAPAAYVYLGYLPLEEAQFTPELEELMHIADGFKRLGR